MGFLFPKSEKLKSEKAIKEVFSKGKGVFKYPFKVVILPKEFCVDEQLPQVMVSVPKRAFKKAVDRNRIKRQMREAYRLHKEEWLAETGNKPAYLAIMYVAKEHNTSVLIQKKLKKVLSLLTEQYLRKTE